ncbi:hypothetical protein O7623_10880 [Solwaraspora sp. WMMD791]|uniref:hypothetical protein n=1 Tax=Solwaraspora sp. WMMD791 TaxID=3016086 RepID=UPI002499C65B|nr:hypothetical protein [Solwaraspora sp. WMMD791]WFE29651.1 hypothetical protein O7623_10880 [Solwaraspora sp. WMMD791]
MSIHLVDVVQVLHTCPADPQPHPYDIRRTLVHVTPGGPCRAPVTIRCGNTTTTIDCGRHRPAAHQCGACRTTVVERTITHRTPQQGQR